MIQSIVGLIAFVLLAWLVSENRRGVKLRIVLTGLGLQLLLGLILLRLPFFRDLFLGLNRVILALEESTKAGTIVVFGYLGGDSLPYEEVTTGASYVLAFRGLPLVLLVSALSSLLFFWKVLPVIVRGFSWALQRTMRIGGAEGVGVSANIFVGMVEAPLLVRPYLKGMTRSEIFSLMTCGMATIAGTVMVLYASVLGGVIDNALGHILTASIISAPAAITIAKIMIPETQPLTTGKLVPPVEARSWMDAITKGTVQGVQLLINIVAMIIVLVALVHLVNLILGIIPDIKGEPLTLQRALGWIMAPIVWLMGIPWRESLTAGSLMGTKTVLNELIAYIDLSQIAEGTLSAKSRTILMYAMCGFANPGSLGIMIGGLGAMAPERRDEIVALGLRSILAGTLATCMTGAVVGIFLG
ncbi:MAG: nucleoside:proton symporter [Candidatus Latescibacterota bacterium]|nr:MAG: nucleoside:proton symporter [Candidatus Latescibacterota bacterium]